MAFWLADRRDGQVTDWIHRFDPRFWTVNFPRPMMAAVTTIAADALRVDAVFYCPHSPDEGCDCRKPKPGLFLQIGERYGVDLANVPTAGDSLRDLLAGAAAGCEPHLLLTGMGQALRGVPLPPEYPPNTQVHEDLAAFVDFLLEREERATLKVAV